MVMAELQFLVIEDQSPYFTGCEPGLPQILTATYISGNVIALHLQLAMEKFPLIESSSGFNSLSSSVSGPNLKDLR
jgi:hypothetical protein